MVDPEVIVIVTAIATARVVTDDVTWVTPLRRKAVLLASLLQALEEGSVAVVAHHHQPPKAEAHAQAHPTYRVGLVKVRSIKLTT